jgi:hypothetical protein
VQRNLPLNFPNAGSCRAVGGQIFKFPALYEREHVISTPVPPGRFFPELRDTRCRRLVKDTRCFVADMASANIH